MHRSDQTQNTLSDAEAAVVLKNIRLSIKFPPKAARTCGECSLCCKVFDIEISPGFDYCPHCRPGNGCAIYHGNRPDICKKYRCAWLAGFFPDEWKPSTCHIVPCLEGERAFWAFHVDPDFPDAWREEPYYSQIRQMMKEDDPELAIIHVGRRKWLVRPHEDEEITGRHYAVINAFSYSSVIVFDNQEEYFKIVSKMIEPF